MCWSVKQHRNLKHLNPLPLDPVILGHCAMWLFSGTCTGNINCIYVLAH